MEVSFGARGRDFVTVYNGCGRSVWQNRRPEQKNGQRSITLALLRKLDVHEMSKLAQLNDYPELGR